MPNSSFPGTTLWFVVLPGFTGAAEELELPPQAVRRILKSTHKTNKLVLQPESLFSKTLILHEKVFGCIMFSFS